MPILKVDRFGTTNTGPDLPDAPIHPGPPGTKQRIAMSLIQFEGARHSNPVDTIESIAGHHEWPFDRSGENEITISVKAGLADYHVSFAWMEDLEAVHLSSAFDLKVTERRKTEVMRLLSLVNEQMWIGHFDLWSQEALVMFRQTLLPESLPNVSAETRAECVPQ